MKLKASPTLYTIATAVVVFNFSSCKYEDGPALSLKTKTGRLVGEWNIEKLAGDKVSGEMEAEMEFEKNGDLNLKITYSYYGYSYTYDSEGTWEWEDGKETINMEFDGDNYEFEVKRLTNDELWMEDEDGEEWELEKK